MASTTRSSKGDRLAREIDAELDSLMAEFDRLIEQRKREEEDRDVTLLIISENSGRFFEIEQFFQKITTVLMFGSAARLSNIYGVALPAHLNQVKVQAAQQRLQARLNGFIEEARLLGMVTMENAAGATIDLVLTPRNVDSLRKAVEFAAALSANQGIQEAGRGTFKKKRAVAILDKDTTDLCRRRMNGQVVDWDEYFVDPVSGSRWLHSPFVGGKLSKAELFHSCRTVIVPA